jgi:hypothetical protein
MSEHPGGWADLDRDDPDTAIFDGLPVVPGAPGTPASWSGRLALLTDARDRVLAIVGRLMPVARRVHQGIGVLVVAGAVAAVFIAGVAAVLSTGEASGRLFGALVLALFLAVPALVLWAFRRALGEVLLLPEKLRRYPDLVRGHAPELARMALAARGDGRRAGRRGGLLRDVGRSVRLLYQLVRAKGDVPDRRALLPLVSVPFLIAVLASVAAVILEVAFAGLLLFALPLALALR